MTLKRARSLTSVSLLLLASCHRSPSVPAPAPVQAPPPVSVDMPAAATPSPSPSVAPPVVDLTPLTCTPDKRQCLDVTRQALTCQTHAHRTGVGQGLARTCQVTNCGAGVCPVIPLLTGEAVNSDERPSKLAPHATVRVWPDRDRAHAQVVRTDERGQYALTATQGRTYWVQVEGEGFITERHAVTMGADGWDVPLDLRHASTLTRLTDAPPQIDVSQGAMVVEFVGDVPRVGLGVDTTPVAPWSVVFDAKMQPVQARRIGHDGFRLQVLAGVRGPVALTFGAPPGIQCGPQATGVQQWLVEPNVLLQVDTECAAVVR